MEKSEFLVNALSSTTAGLIGRFACHPIDTCKAKLQVTDKRRLRDVISSTWKKEGIPGFYKGIGAVLVGGVPGVCVYITTYDQSKAQLLNYQFGRDNPFLVYLSSGMIAEAVCCALFIPVDVVKERLQVQSTKNLGYKYKGSFDALKTIFREEGYRGLYKGYFATLFSYGPFSAIYFGVFEEFKKLVRRKNDGKQELSFSQNLLCSATAGGIASYLTNPLDIAKLRFQVQQSSLVAGSVSSTTHYTGLFHATQDIYRVGGFRGLFRGATARVLFHTPTTAITMAVYEECKSWWTYFLQK
eukprot:gene4760-5110_t